MHAITGIVKSRVGGITHRDVVKLWQQFGSRRLEFRGNNMRSMTPQNDTPMMSRTRRAITKFVEVGVVIDKRVPNVGVYWVVNPAWRKDVLAYVRKHKINQL